MYRSLKPVDLMITDLGMPVMSGKQLIRELKKEPPHLKALGITGYALTTIRMPFDVSTLAQAGRRVLDEK